MAGAIDTLSAKTTVGIQWSALDAIAGAPSVVNDGNGSAVASLSSSTAPAVAGGANQVLHTLLTIAGAGSTTIDLSSFTNVVNLAASFARIKGIRIRLLSASQTAIDGSTAGSAATHIVVGNNGSNDLTSQSGGRGWFSGATHEWVIPSGGTFSFDTGANATGVLVDGTHKIIKITNGDASVAAKVEVTVLGGEA